MTPPPIFFDDPELWTVEALRNGLSQVRPSVAYIGVTVPDKRPGEFITVRPDGGSIRDHVIGSFRVSVNAWALTEQAVSEISRLVSTILFDAVDGRPVTNVTLMGGPSAIPDAQPRRLAVYDLTMRGSALGPA